MRAHPASNLPSFATSDGLESRSRGNSFAQSADSKHPLMEHPLNHDMAFASLDEFAPVEAVLFAGTAGFDRLTVDATCRRGRFAPFRHPHLLPQGTLDTGPDAVAFPALEVVVNGSPGRKVPRQHPPRAAGAVEVEDGISHLAQVRFTRPTVLGCWRDERLQQGPLLIREIARIRRISHPPIIANTPLWNTL